VEGEKCFKSVVINSFPVKFSSPLRKLGFIAVDFESPSILFIVPSSDGEKLYMFCIREDVRIKYKYLKLMREEDMDVKPLREIRVKRIGSRSRILKKVKINSESGVTPLLIFTSPQYGKLYITFSRSGDKIDIELVHDEVTFEALELKI